MRSVKAPQRPSPRIKAGRRGASPARAPRRERFGKREKFNDGSIARFYRDVPRLLVFRLERQPFGHARISALASPAFT